MIERSFVGNLNEADTIQDIQVREGCLDDLSSPQIVLKKDNVDVKNKKSARLVVRGQDYPFDDLIPNSNINI